MITNKGKSVISKYMVGQTTSYASYLAIGCGPTPLNTSHVFTTEEKNAMKERTELQFETLRVPIISRGYVTEIVNDVPVSQLVLTAQLPAASRYGITEVGIYPAANNPVANNNDSRMLLNFDNTESWVLTDTSLETPTSTKIVDGSIDTVSPTTIFANSLDSVLTNPGRILNNEIPRNGSSAIVTPGDLSTFSSTTPQDGKYLVLTNSGINLSNSSPIDKLKIAFSILPKTDLSLINGTAKIVVEFGDQQGIGGGGYARAVFTKSISESSSPEPRYFTSEILVGDIAQYGNFSWNNATYVKVFAYIGSSHLIALDGLRLDNVASESPVYGLVGYTEIKNLVSTTGGTSGPAPVIKEKDKTSLIEFRFQVSVG